MTKQDDSSQSNFETDVSQLYEQRKRRYRATSSMKRQSLQHPAVSSNWRNLFSRFQVVGITASTLLLISLLVLQSYELDNSQSQITYTSVTIHSLDATTEQDYSQIRTVYQQHSNAFKQQKVLLARHHHKSAVLSQFNDSWELKTCDQELVKISKELIDVLSKMDLISTNLKTGDRVQVAFNANGLIVGIEPTNNVLQCT